MRICSSDTVEAMGLIEIAVTDVLMSMLMIGFSSLETCGKRRRSKEAQASTKKQVRRRPSLIPFLPHDI